MQKIRLAGFASREFNNAQQNYSTHDKELLVIVVELSLFQSILSGTTFTIRTDHKPLVAFMSPMELLEWQSQWQQTIYQFDCEIKHIDGLKNYIVDAFCRIWLNPNAVSSNNSDILQQVDLLQKRRNQLNITSASINIKPTVKEFKNARKMSNNSRPMTPPSSDVY